MKNIRSFFFILILGITICVHAADCFAQTEKREAVVKSLYRDFGWEIKTNNISKKSLIDHPLPVLQQYFTPRLSTLIRKDRKYEEKTKELGHLDFGLLCGSQDPDGITNIRIYGNPGKSVVTVMYDQNGEKDVMKIEYITQKTKSGWRISDVHYRTRKSNALPEPGLDVRLLYILAQPY